MHNQYIKLVENFLNVTEEPQVEELGDFTLTFDDYSAYQIRDKEDAGIPEDRATILKLQKIEELGKMKEFLDADWESYMKARENWRISPDYLKTSLFDFRTGGVTVANGEVTLDMNMRD